MPRRKVIHSEIFPYHVSARVNNREQFPGDLPFIWKVHTGELLLSTVLHQIRLHAFVLMPNHFHLLVSTPKTPVSKVMQDFLSACTRIINTRYRRTGHLYGGRYHWSLIKHPLYYAHALKYVYRNPVKAGLSESVETYPFSSFSGLIGETKLPIPILSPLQGIDRLIPKSSSLDQLQQWLNRSYNADESAAIQIGLKKKIFRPPVAHNNRKIFHLPAVN